MRYVHRSLSCVPLVGALVLAVSACSGSGSPHPSTSASGSATPRRPSGVAVFVQSHAGSAIAFQLPPGWQLKSARRELVTYAAANGSATVTVGWALSPTLMSLTQLVADAKTSTARAAGKAGEYACLTTPADINLLHGRISETFENPCGHAGALSAWLAAKVPTRPAPDGRRVSTATWIGTGSQEQWSIVYTAPEGRTDPAVQRAVNGAQLQQLAAQSIYSHTIPGAQPTTPVHVPDAWQPASAIKVPKAALPGAAATDACQLVSRTDAADVPEMPPYGGTTHVPPVSYGTSACHLSYADRSKTFATSAPFTASMTVSLLDRPLSTAAVGDGVSGSSHGIPTISTLDESDGDFTAGVYLATGPSSTVSVVFSGQRRQLSTWEQVALAAVADRVAERLATGNLAPAVTTAHTQQRGAVVDGMQFGQLVLDPSGKTVCTFVPDLTRLVGSPVRHHTGYPPSCDTTEQVAGVEKAYLSLWDGHPLDEAIEQDDSFVPGVDGGPNVYTRTVHGVTAVVDLVPPPGYDYGWADAAVAISPTQWVEVSVTIAVHGSQRAAIRLRDRLVAAVAKAAT